jgi:hypothetical protein
MIYGPNTNLAHGGSAIFHSECQVRYIMLAIRELIEGQAPHELAVDLVRSTGRQLHSFHARLGSESGAIRNRHIKHTTTSFR